MLKARPFASFGKFDVQFGVLHGQHGIVCSKQHCDMKGIIPDEML
jgi:hypothetical protein